MDNVIIILAIGIIAGCAGYYVYKAKKRGAKCIGCSHDCSCCKKHAKP